MRSERPHLRRSTLGLILGFCLLIAFQNCGMVPQFSSIGAEKGVTQSSSNGDIGPAPAVPISGAMSGNGYGYDGKPYIHIAACGNTPRAIESRLFVANDKSKALVLREACQDLAVPRPVSAPALLFGGPESGSLRLAEDPTAPKIFDLETSTDQRRTLAICVQEASVSRIEAILYEVNSAAAPGTFTQGAMSGYLKLTYFQATPASGTTSSPGGPPPSGASATPAQTYEGADLRGFQYPTQALSTSAAGGQQSVADLYADGPTANFHIHGTSLSRGVLSWYLMGPGQQTIKDVQCAFDLAGLHSAQAKAN